MNGDSWTVLQNIEVYPHDKEAHARLVYGTLDQSHPAVAEIMGSGDYLLGGDIAEYHISEDIKHKEFYYSPAETKKMFSGEGMEDRGCLSDAECAASGA